MRVCLATTGFPRWLGDGQCAFVFEAARAIARQGIEMTVIAMHSPGLPVRSQMDGIKVVRPKYWWPEQWEILRKEGAAGIPATWKKRPVGRLQILPFALVHSLNIALLARHCDLVHAEWTLSAAAACFGRYFHRRPILATLQGSDVFQVTKHPLGARLTRRVLSRCDRITVLSQALANATASIGIPRDHIQIIPNGVDSDLFTLSASNTRENVILYVGSLIERKGVHHLLAAMPDILRQFPNIHLQIIGDGPQYPTLKQHTSDLGIANHVTFLGFQSQDQVRSRMQKAKLCIVPSLEEGQGVVSLEAMACGTPVVASRIDGIPEIVTPETGVLIPPGDSQALSAAVVEILQAPGRWDQLSHRARERAATHYDWDLIASQYVEVYRSMAT